MVPFLLFIVFVTFCVKVVKMPAALAVCVFIIASIVSASFGETFSGVF